MRSLQDVFSDVLLNNIVRIKNGPDILIRTNSGNEYKPSVAKKLMSNICYYEHQDTAGNIKRVDVFEKLLEVPDDDKDWPVCKHEIDFTMPYGLNPKKRTFNIFKGFDMEPEHTGADTSVLWNHVKFLFSSVEPDNQEWAIDWISQIFQEPNKKMGTALVLISQEGSGKGLFFDSLLSRILGRDYVINTSCDPFDKNFNGNLKYKILLNLNEGGWNHKKDTKGQLKNFITDPTFRYEEKFREAEMLLNPTRIVMTTNEDWAVSVRNDDRRYFVVEIPSDHIGDANYFETLVKSIEDDNICRQFYYEMIQRQITHNLRMAPKTEFHKEQQLHSSSYFDKFIETVVDCLDGTDTISVLNLNAFFGDMNFNKFETGTNFPNSIMIPLVDFAKIMSDYTKILITGQKLGALLRKAALPWIEITTFQNRRIVNILLDNKFNGNNAKNII
jgi:hypothetical protein